MYNFNLADGSTLPQWIGQDAENRVLHIESNNLQTQGQYVIVLTGSTKDTYQYRKMSKTVSIMLSVKFDCAQDEITSLKKVEDQIIMLEDGGVPFKFSPSFT